MKDAGATELSQPNSIQASLRKMEWSGMRLALCAKGLIIAVMSAYLYLTIEPPALYWPLGFVILFLLTTLVQGLVSYFRAQWIMFLIGIIFIEAIALAVVITVPNPFSGFNLPEQMPYRTSYFALLILYGISIGFAYRPAIALAAGIGCALAWTVLSLRVLFLPETIGWETLPTEGATTADIAALYGQVHFFSSPSRVVEITMMLLSAALVAGLVQRSRSLVRRSLLAEQEREQSRAEQAFIRETFGKYVPDAVASAILSDRGRLVPQKRLATVLFVDLEGFTALGERLGAEALLDMLNAYFDAAGKVIMEHGGTINQFQGDAILASFNVPVPEADHASHAVRAAKALLDLVERERFAGQQVSIRIGIHTGDLIAGTVGTETRLSFTVHGSTVNIAARLEQLNKAKQTRILLSDQTVQAIGAPEEFVEVGDTPITGIEHSVKVFSLKSSP
ncbi:MAG: adenylate/guanylate cyclase domain-containing protein [Rhodospirillaceae bacterium]